MLIDDSRVSRMMFIKFVYDAPLSFDVIEADCGEQIFHKINMLNTFQLIVI